METIHICIIAILALAFIYLTYLKEQFDSNLANSYQGKQPWYLSPSAPKQWMIPAKKLCKDRVVAECANVPMVERIGCVQKALLECEQYNSAYISQDCVNNLPNSYCKEHCKEGNKSSKCLACVYYAQSQGVCLKPEIEL